MDIALAVERICEDAVYTRSATYAELEKTWKDARPIPTEWELSIAWTEILDLRALAHYDAVRQADRVILLCDKELRDKMTTDERLDMLIEATVTKLES